MGKRRDAKRRRADERDAKPRVPAPTPRLPPSEPPAFWFGFAVPWAKLATARVLVFGLLALDAVLALRHAPRYGAGGFNVAQLPLLDALGPTRGAYAVCQLALAYLFVLAACGVATRAVVPIAAAIDAWLYFGSQLDSYQHHYLVVLVLGLAACVPWQRPDGARADTPVRSWALRLILVQLGIMYFYAAVSKLSGAWLDGRTLGLQIAPAPDKLIDLRAWIDGSIGMAATAKLVVAVELGLAATVWTKRFAAIVAPVGILFHLGIVVIGFDIGLFAWIMIGAYALVLPDAWLIAAAESPPGRAAVAIARGLAARFAGAAGATVACALGVALGTGLAAATRLPFAVYVASGAALAALAIAVRARPATRAWLGVVHVLAIALWLVVDRTTTVAVDYARYWGGSSRRLGDRVDAIRAYRRMVELAPDEPAGHYQLGRLLLDDDADAGLAELRASQRLDSSHARAYVAEARWLAAHGQREAAIAKAKEGTYAEPGNAEAQKLVAQLTGTARPGGDAGSGAGSDGD